MSPGTRRRQGAFFRAATTACLVAGLAARPLPAQTPLVCGVERWRVKVMIDDDTALVDLSPAPTTVSALAGLPRPAGTRPATRRLPLERRTFRVRAILVDHDFSDDDSDIRMVLRDPATGGTLIAEIPDSACALGSPHQSAYAAARRVVERLPPLAMVEVEGVAFWDDPHGQAGMAPNAIELHPVLRVTPDATLTEFGADPPALGNSPADTSSVGVWLNLDSRVYHCAGTRYFGRTSRGARVTQAEARRRGGRPAGGRPCPANAPDTGSVRRP